MMRKFIGFKMNDKCCKVKLYFAPMIINMLEGFKMSRCNSVPTPSPSGIGLRIDEGEVLTAVTPHWQLVGGLRHFSNTVRPKISYAAGYLACIMHRPTKQLWNAAKFTLRYLKGSTGLGLVCRANFEKGVLASSDSDWRQDHPNRKCVNGNIITIAGSSVRRPLKQQSGVAQRSMEVEVVLLSGCVKEVLWGMKTSNIINTVLHNATVESLYST